MKELENFKINEVFSYKFIQVPQELSISPLYKNNLNSDSKLLYGYLVDRMSLSQKNNWCDKNGNVYIIFTREEAQEVLNVSDKTARKAFKQLSDANLIREDIRGFGKPNIIYVGKIQHEELRTENIPYMSGKNSDSRTENFTATESEILPAINTNNIKTNIINTESINPKNDEDILNSLKEKCNLNDFAKDEKIILEDVIDSLYFKNNIKVGNIVVNRNKILEKLQLIVKENLIQLLEILKNIPNIQNAKNYLMICLYNNLGNKYVPVKNKAVTIKLNQRDYPEGSLDFLYANYDIAKATT